jgi:hypothetical protein
VAAILAAVHTATDTGGTLVDVWWGALVVASAASLVVVATGIADLSALQPRSRAFNAASLHAAIMLGGVAVLVAVTVRMGISPGGPSGDAVDLALTLTAFVVLTGGALGGLLAAHVYGAGLREETLKPAVTGSTSPQLPDEA